MSFNAGWVNTSDNSEWATPKALFAALDAEFHFTLDVCASKDNAKCRRYFDKAADGLKQDWSGEIVYMNPPYRDIRPWIEKAAGTKGSTIVALLPAKTDTAWFHEYIYIYMIGAMLKSGLYAAGLNTMTGNKMRPLGA